MIRVRFLAVFISLFLLGCSQTIPKELIGKRYPYVNVQLVDGRWINLEKLQGRNTAVIFWTTWCPQSAPVMRRIKEFAGSGGIGQRSELLTVSLDETKNEQKVRDSLAEFHGANFIHAFSGNEGADEAYMTFKGEDLPYIVLLSPNSTIMGIHRTDDEEVYKFLSQ